MREQFTKGFADIQREFNSAFRDLFGGGRGSLELVEYEDILEETVTDFDGHYCLPIPVGNDGLLLKFTYVGMKTQEIKYKGQTRLDVYMKPQKRKKEVK